MISEVHKRRLGESLDTIASVPNFLQTTKRDSKGRSKERPKNYMTEVSQSLPGLGKPSSERLNGFLKNSLVKVDLGSKPYEVKGSDTQRSKGMCVGAKRKNIGVPEFMRALENNEEKNLRGLKLEKMQGGSMDLDRREADCYLDSIKKKMRILAMIENDS
jgi:hypothetical protein